MLDRVHAASERRLDAFASHGVSGHFVSEPVSFVNQGVHLLVGEVHPRVQRAVSQIISAIGIVLDPIGAVLDLFAHGFANVVGAVYDLNALGNFQLPRIAA